MKFASILISILAVGFQTQAMAVKEASESPASIERMTLVGVQQESLPSAQSSLQGGKANSIWNINLGVTQFNQNSHLNANEKGSGLSVELQKKFAEIYYLGGSYTNYKVETQATSGSTSEGFFSSKTYRDEFTLSLEAHVIRLPLPNHSEFFAAVDGGYQIAGTQGQLFESKSENFYYGAGVGFNYRNQVGVRADLRSSRDYSTYNSISLVGYY